MNKLEKFPNPYRDMIIEDLGCTIDDAAIVENLMRNEIFHSTLGLADTGSVA